jgi:hypothetical protein
MSYQTIIANREEINDWDSLISDLQDNGILWVISNDIYEKDKTEPLTFELIENLTNKGLILKNVILWINRFEEINNILINNYKNILFFVKSEDYYFNKDPIREKHIWKDVEWGQRAKNYNPKGKDPSNVWILTEDDNKGKITGFKPLDLNEVIKRCILCSTKEKDKVLLRVRELKKLNLNREINYG